MFLKESVCLQILPSPQLKPLLVNVLHMALGLLSPPEDLDLIMIGVGLIFENESTLF